MHIVHRTSSYGPRFVSTHESVAPAYADEDAVRKAILFSTRLADAANAQFGYAVDPAGQRFLMWSVADQANNTPITIVQSRTAAPTK